MASASAIAALIYMINSQRKHTWPKRRFLMTWLQRYRIRHYFANSIWILPLLSMAAAMGSVRFLHWIEQAMGWESALNPETALALLGTMAASMFTFIVFVSSALLVAVQLASSQLTPRIIAIVFRDPVTRFALVIFVFAFTFSLSVLIRITTVVPPLTAHLAAYSCLASLGVFLYLIDHVGKSLRPSGALWAVARLGRRVIECVYPRPLPETLLPTTQPYEALAGQPTRTVPNRKDGVVLAFDGPGLVSLGQSANCIIELVPQVGDFVAVGEPLFRIVRGAERSQRKHFANPLPWVRNARWSKTQLLHSEFSSISPTKDFHLQSMIRRPQYWPWTKFITCFATWDVVAWMMDGFAMRPARFV